MTDVIDFFVWIQSNMWSLIVSNWILSISVLIAVIGFIVDLVNGSRQSR